MRDPHKIKKYASSLISISNKSNQDLKDIIKNLLSFKNLLRDLPELRYLLLSKRISLTNDFKHSLYPCVHHCINPLQHWRVLLKRYICFALHRCLTFLHIFEFNDSQANHLPFKTTLNTVRYRNT